LITNNPARAPARAGFSERGFRSRQATGVSSSRKFIGSPLTTAKAPSICVLFAFLKGVRMKLFHAVDEGDHAQP
jgi:hypothetical protein